jgi:L-alanine-DL-glutamate epimerase-like enolase superfamily enzyme
MKVTTVERILLQSPFYPINVPHMARVSGDWSVIEVCRVTTDTGIVGYGETIVNYTWARVTDEAVAHVTGRDPFEVMWDDSLGAGLQIACFDVAGKAIGQPCHRLLGPQFRRECPISYWDMDMPGEEWAAEARRAVELGYTSFKLKGRPWRDLLEQLRAVSEVVQPEFKLDVDFNDHLLTIDQAIPYLKAVEECPNVAMFESPLPQGDVPAAKQLRCHIATPIAHHYGSPPIMTALREDVCDGFVVSGGASSVRRQATVAAEANKPFFLQLVGTGITTAWLLHLGAVFSHARWPAVTCHELYTDDLISRRHPVRHGFATVPEGPGLGVTVDEDALERLRVETPVRDRPWDMVVVAWPDGRRVYYSDKQQCQRDFWAGNQPLFERGVRLEMLKDDGSAEFSRLKEQVKMAPVTMFER